MSEEHRKRCGLGPLQGLCNSLLSDGDAGGSDGDDVVLIEELSVEEVERRKLERAKREGALVDLVSSDDDGVSVIDLVSSDDNDKGRGRKRKAQEKRAAEDDVYAGLKELQNRTGASVASLSSAQRSSSSCTSGRSSSCRGFASVDVRSCASSACTWASAPPAPSIITGDTSARSAPSSTTRSR